MKDRVHFLRSYLQPLLEKGWLERTIPDKPRSRLQRYRKTKAGLMMLEKYPSLIADIDGITKAVPGVDEN